jgi:predicted Zn-dependent peptidase
VAATAPTLESLTEGARASGFVARALYTDDEGRARGARFVHERTGFVFDYLRIESAPQAFLWVTTYPTSDDGAPHTQEHLLLGKGNKGRALGNYEHVMLARSSAFTSQHRTAYHFNTAADAADGEAFWGLLHTYVEALMRPDYSDEEILREVRNFGVARLPGGRLELAEKGTVYNEMVGTYDSSNTLAWYAMQRLIYGANHPLAFSSGGSPEGIRGLTPEAIRRFHEAHYQLGNMGMVGAFSSAVTLATALARVGRTLDAFAAPSSPASPAARFMTDADVPEARGAKPGTVRVVDFPYKAADHPGPALLVWPATRHLSVPERTVLESFLLTIAGGEGSDVYKALIDQKTRTLDVGATDVWKWVQNDRGQAAYVGFENVRSAHANEASLRAMRAIVLTKIREVAAFADGSSELAAFNERVRSRIKETERSLDKLLDTPPEFGTRGTSERWIEQLDDVNREDGFKKTITQKAAFARARAAASSRENVWREGVKTWGLLEEPYAVVARASPALRKELDEARTVRVATELARLEAAYGTTDAQAALARRDAEIAKASEEIARAEARVPMPPFMSDPPMTFDDALAFRTEAVRGVPVVDTTFEMMKSATAGLALRVDGVREEDLPLLSLLPTMLESVGVLEEGRPVPYDLVRDRLRREVLSIDMRFDASSFTDRIELTLSGSGNDVGEATRALGWMRTFLTSPDWRVENLPRIRDVLAHRATELHDVMNQREEFWAEDTAEAYRRQSSAALAHTSSFLTRGHDALRVAWMLDGGGARVATLLEGLADAGKRADRAGLTALASALAGVDAKVPPSLARYVAQARALVAEDQAHAVKAGKDLGQVLGDVPDASLASDWSYLCKEMARGARRNPKETLDGFRRVLAAVAHANVARAWVVGSSRAQAALAPEIDRLMAALDATPVAKANASTRARVTERARARGAAGSQPNVVALINASAASGTLVTSAPTAGFFAGGDDDAALVDFLAANVFSGTGGHSFYKRIWGAALAYSGYAWVRQRAGRAGLYSDRCADLRQLLTFVDGEVRRAPANARFVEYAIANGFGSRVADTYESRARSIAEDLADGLTPDRVRAFRAKLLALRTRAGLGDRVHERLAPVFARVLPTLDGASPLPASVQWFAIGPDSQIDGYERALKAARGETLTVLRLYPRDFWDVPPPSP